MFTECAGRAQLGSEITYSVVFGKHARYDKAVTNGTVPVKERYFPMNTQTNCTLILRKVYKMLPSL